MSPRLEAAPLTQEDSWILFWGPDPRNRRAHRKLWHALDPLSTAQDRRDAELMLALSSCYRPKVRLSLSLAVAHVLLKLNDAGWDYVGLQP